MLIDATHPEETRVVVVDGNRVEEFDYESITKVQIAGNIYLAKVTRVEPALHAAFVDYGGNRHGFLAFAEIHPDYYQIPVADREALLAAEKAEAQREADAESDAGRGSRRSESESSEDGDRKRGRRRQKRRGRRGGEKLALASLEGVEAPTEQMIATAEAAGWTDAPALDLSVETAETTADGRPLPDLSDVTEIEIRRAASEAEEAATGESVVVETIAVPGAAAAEEPAHQTVSEDAGANLRDTLRGAPIVESDNVAEEETETAEAESAREVETSDEESGDEDNADGDDVSDDETGDDDSDDEEYDGETASDDDGASDDEDESGDDEDGETGSRSRRNRRRQRRGRNRRGDRDDDGAEDEESGSSRGEIEEIGADDARDEIRPRSLRLRDYKIQEVIKRRQILLVQVVKEERGTKGAALTTYLSLAGRYCVLMPNTARGGGISRKITNAADRKRLKAVASEMEVPEGMGLIIRTAGANRTKAEIKRDYEYLLRQWSAIRDLTLSSIAPTLIYEEGSLIKRAIRDLYNRDIDTVLVEGEDAYREAKDYMKMLMPSHAKNVQSYREQTPLFIRYQVESQMSAMLTPTVQLKSGGYIVIGVTEALVAIDVNSGRSTKESSIEETALKTNLEAAEEAARQMKLRDLAGLIVIDFIDMEEPKNNRAVEKRLKDKLKNDRARIQVGRISGFGLLEMSRQRLRPGLLETTTVCCPHCSGSGVIRSEESMALSILRSVEEEGLRGRSPALRVGAPVSVANYIINQKRARLSQIEARYGIQVIVEADPTVISPDFSLDRVKPLAREVIETRAVQIEAGFEADDEYEDEVEEAVEVEDETDAETGAESSDDRSEKESGGRSRRRRRRGERREADSAENEDVEAGEETAASDAEADDEDKSIDQKSADDGSGDGSRKRRGRRGGRRRRRSDEESGGDPMPVIDLDADDSAEEAPSGAEAATAEKVEKVEKVEKAAEPVSQAQSEEVEPTAASEAVEEEPAAAAEEETPPKSEAPELTVVAASEDEATAPEPAREEAKETAAEPQKQPEPAAAESGPRRAAEDGPRRTGWWAFRRGA